MKFYGVLTSESERGGTVEPDNEKCGNILTEQNNSKHVNKTGGKKKWVTTGIPGVSIRKVNDLWDCERRDKEKDYVEDVNGIYRSHENTNYKL